MLFGLVELHVDLTGLTAPGQPEAVMAGVRRDTRRAETVRAAVGHALRLGCAFVVLPGWTLVADEPPAWLLSLSAGVIVVAECLRPDGASRRAVGRVKGQARQPRVKGGPTADDEAGPVWHGYVLHDGRVVVGPARQCFAEADELSAAGAELIGQLLADAPAGRRWAAPGVGPALLLLCGEVGVVGGRGGCWHRDAVTRAGLSEAALWSPRLVVNPAHTWTRLQPMRDKRSWLSLSGLLLHTANTHSAGWRKGPGEDAVAGQASHTARAWADGELAELDAHAGDGYAILTLEWGP